jgi:hypothetical protein
LPRGCACSRTYHRLGSKRLDLLDSTRGPLLEGDTVELRKTSAVSSASLPICCMTYALVHVDGVLAGDHVGDSRALGLALGLLGRHSGSNLLAGVARSIFRIENDVLERFEKIFGIGATGAITYFGDVWISCTRSRLWCRGVVDLAGVR